MYFNYFIFNLCILCVCVSVRGGYHRVLVKDKRKCHVCQFSLLRSCGLWGAQLGCQAYVADPPHQPQ